MIHSYLVPRVEQERTIARLRALGLDVLDVVRFGRATGWWPCASAPPERVADVLREYGLNR